LQRGKLTSPPFGLWPGGKREAGRDFQSAKVLPNFKLQVSNFDAWILGFGFQIGYGIMVYPHVPLSTRSDPRHLLVIGGRDGGREWVE
jgi:hypothetical protein